VALSGIHNLQRITYDTLREQQIPGGPEEYRRVLGSEGREYNISLNIDRQTFDELLAAGNNLVVWCKDESEGCFHAIMELAGLRNVDYPNLIAASLNFLVRDNVFVPENFNPKVFA
jgi:hypothetical protein